MAVELGRRCVDLRREVLGEDHPETIDSLSDLAGGLQELGDFEAAEAMQRQAFEASTRVLGAEHLDTLNCLTHLASVLDSLARYEEAEAALRKVIEVKSRVLGAESPSVFAELHNLALALHNQNKHVEAEPIYRRVLALKESVYGKGHIETLVTLSALVMLLSGERRFDDIRELRAWFREGPVVIQDKEYFRDDYMLRHYKFRLSGSSSGSEESSPCDGGDESTLEDVKDGYDYEKDLEQN